MITVVSGLGGCGSSMVMKMCLAAGLPPTGDARASFWEDSRTVLLTSRSENWKRRYDASWLDDCKGGVIKLLNPTVSVPPPRADWRWIWVDRDPEEMTKSQLKISASLGKRRRPGRVEDWRRESLEVIERVGGEVLFLSYEQILDAPILHAARLVDYIGKGDAGRVAAVVRKRSPKCSPEVDPDRQFSRLVELPPAQKLALVKAAMAGKL